MVGFTTRSLDRNGIARNVDNYIDRINKNINKTSLFINHHDDHAILEFINKKMTSLYNDKSISEINNIDDKNREILARLHDEITPEEFNQAGFQKAGNRANLRLISETLSRFGIEKVGKFSWFKNEIATQKINALKSVIDSVISPASINKSVSNYQDISGPSLGKNPLAISSQNLVGYENLITESSNRRSEINQRLPQVENNGSLLDLTKCYQEMYSNNATLYHQQIKYLYGYLVEKKDRLVRQIEKNVDLKELSEQKDIYVHEGDYGACEADKLSSLGSIDHGTATMRCGDLSHFWFNPLTHNIGKEQIMESNFESTLLTKLSSCYVTGSSGNDVKNFLTENNLTLIRLNPPDNETDIFTNECEIQPLKDEISYDEDESKSDIARISKTLANDVTKLYKAMQHNSSDGVVFACQQGMNRSFAYALGYEIKRTLEHLKSKNTALYSELFQNEKSRDDFFSAFSNAKRSDMMCPYAQQHDFGAFMTPSSNSLSLAICNEVFNLMNK